MTNEEFIKTWYQRIWAEEDLSAITELMMQRTQFEGLSKIPQAGPDEFRAFAEALLRHITNMSVEIQLHIQDGQWSSVLIHVRATCIKTGDPVSFSGQQVLRIFGGRLIEAYNHIDFFAMFEQLGKMPPDSVWRCLSGEVIR